MLLAFGFYLVSIFLLYITDGNGWFGTLNHRAAVILCVILLVVWSLVFGFLTVAKKREKAFWFYFEGPLYSFTAKLTLIILFCLLVAFLIVEVSCDAAATPRSAALGSAASLSHASRCPAAFNPLIILLTGALATIGWNYTAYENRRAEIRRFSVETIEKVIEDPIHTRLRAEVEIAARISGPIVDAGMYETYCTLHQQDHYRDTVSYFLSGARPSLDQAESLKLDAMCRIYAIGRYLDQLEWLALLIRQRRIDELLAREMLCDTVIWVTKKLQMFVREARATDRDIYEHTVWLAERWSRQPLPLHP
ncbi:MAG: DUF4760 domain-containing protein [Pseudomonadota bacterium]